MEDIRENGASVKRLNTKGCCFLCLRIEDLSRADVNNFDNVTNYCSIHQLLRHLQINEKFVTKSRDSSTNVDDQLIEVNLCKKCREINGNVEKICQKLEKLQLELNYMLECIHTRVTDSAKDSDRVQNYSKRMTSDLEGLSQLDFVDNLRKEFARKCLKMRTGPIPIIQVTRFKKEHKRALVKQEQTPIENESDVEMNFALPSPFNLFLPDYAEPELSPSPPTPEEIKDVNPPPEVLEQKPPPPLPSSSSTKPTLDVSSSTETQSTAHNNLSKKNQTGSYTRLPKGAYSKNETTGMFHCKKCNGSYQSVGGVRWHYKTVHLHLKKRCQICTKMMDPTRIRRHERACQKNSQRHLATQNDANYADSEPSPSPAPEEIKFNMNPPPEVMEQKFQGPWTSSNSAKHTLDARPSSEIQLTAENKLPQTRAYSRDLPSDLYCLKNETTGMFHCKKCSAIYKGPRSMRWHYQTVHLHLKKKCQICNKLMDPSNLRKHERACRKNPQRHLAKQNDAKFRFICNQCGKKFDTRKKRCQHEIHVHRNANKYPCHLCDKKFNAQIALTIHVDKVHLRKRFSCRFCNISYACRYQSRAHEKKCIKKPNIKVEPEVN